MQPRLQCLLRRVCCCSVVAVVVVVVWFSCCYCLRLIRRILRLEKRYACPGRAYGNGRAYGTKGQRRSDSPELPRLAARQVQLLARRPGKYASKPKPKLVALPKLVIV